VKAFEGTIVAPQVHIESTTTAVSVINKDPPTANRLINIG